MSLLEVALVVQYRLLAHREHKVQDVFVCGLDVSKTIKAAAKVFRGTTLLRPNFMHVFEYSLRWLDAMSRASKLPENAFHCRTIMPQTYAYTYAYTSLLSGPQMLGSSPTSLAMLLAEFPVPEPPRQAALLKPTRPPRLQKIKAFRNRKMLQLALHR